MADLKSTVAIDEQQYAIWRKLSAAKAVKLTSDFSMFLLRLSKINNAQYILNGRLKSKRSKVSGKK